MVPAETVTVPVEVDDTFAATGKRTELKAATGSVRFSNLDPTSQNTIARGSIVSTPSGVRFRTNATITIPAAALAGLTIVPAQKSVKVTAVDQGPEGNVAPNSITSVPRGESPFFLSVTNPDATTGGTRKEFPRVTQKDVDAATAALTTSLQSSFQARLDDPALVSDGSTVFPETAEPARSDLDDPARATWSARRSTTSISARARPARSPPSTRRRSRRSPRQRLTGSVDPGYQLVADSPSVTVDDAVVSGSAVTFPVVATAKQVKLLDPEAIKAAILGKTRSRGQEHPRRLRGEPAATLARLGDHRPDARLACRHPRHRPHRERRAEGIADRLGPSIVAIRASERPVSALLGLDVGEKRIGVAIAEVDGSLGTTADDRAAPRPRCRRGSAR